MWFLKERIVQPGKLIYEHEQEQDQEYVVQVDQLQPSLDLPTLPY